MKPVKLAYAGVLTDTRFALLALLFVWVPGCPVVGEGRVRAIWLTAYALRRGEETGDLR